MPGTRIGNRTPSQVGSFLIAQALGVSTATASANATSMPVVSGTNTYRITKVTVSNPNKDISSGVIGVNTGASNTGKITDGSTAMSSLTNADAAHKVMDLTLASGAANTLYTQLLLYVYVDTAVSGGTVDVRVYGEILS